MPKTSSGTGDVQARAVYDVLRDWKLDGKVEAMCFSANTGLKMRACALLEHLLQCDLYMLLAALEILLFKRFKAQWKLIDHAHSV